MSDQVWSAFAVRGGHTFLCKSHCIGRTFCDLLRIATASLWLPQWGTAFIRWSNWPATTLLPKFLHREAFCVQSENTKSKPFVCFLFFPKYFYRYEKCSVDLSCLVFKTQIDYVSELRIANVSPGEPDKDQTMPGPQGRYMICQRKKRWQGLARHGKALRSRTESGTTSEPYHIGTTWFLATTCSRVCAFDSCGSSHCKSSFSWPLWPRFRQLLELCSSLTAESRQPSVKSTKTI